MVDAERDPLVAVRLVSVGPRSAAAWAEGLTVQMPASVIDRNGWRRALGADGALRVPSGPAMIEERDVASLRERRAFTDAAPPSARLPFAYHAVPGWARAIAASAMGRWNRRRADVWASFPRWPIDLSADALQDLAPTAPDAAPRPAPVVLTHDIDSAEGLKNLVERFLPLEESAGSRSTSYIVPCAWRVDDGLVREVKARGHEVGVHGYDHANRTPFAAPAERARRLDAARGFAERYGATGYRAPSFLRTRALLRDLSARYRYDSSIPSSGGLFPTPNNGCATARPFLVEQIVELPVTLPRDGALRFLGHRPDEILRLWIDCAAFVARARGVVVLLTHCERRFSGHPAMLDAYRRFLEHAAADASRFAFSTPARVLAGAT